MIYLREIGPQGLRKRLEDMAKSGLSTRKKSFDDRLSIYRGRHKHLIDQRIHQVYDLPSVRTALCKFASTRRNLLKRVANTVAIAYDHPPSRELKGAEKKEQAEFLSAYAQAETAIAAEEWGKMAFVANVVHVIPRLVGDEGRLEWVTVLPHKADVLIDWASGDRKPSVLVYDANMHGACKVAIDAERWWWLNDRWEVVAEEEHSMGMVPWVPFRFSTPPEDDYWDAYNGSELVEATLDVARIAAQLAWTRKGHASDILYLFLKDKDAEVPPNQTVNAEAPLMGRGDAEFGRVENIVGVDEFLKEIADIVDDVSDSYGLPSSMIDGDGVPDARAHAQLVKVRNGQIKHHEHSEIELAVRVVALLRQAGRMTLSDEQVREMFKVRFAPLSFADHPKTQVETSQALSSLGADDPYQFYMQLHPELTFEEARLEVLQHVANRAEFHDLVTSRNLPLEARDDALTLPQLQGQVGGKMAVDKMAMDIEEVGEPNHE